MRALREFILKWVCFKQSEQLGPARLGTLRLEIPADAIQKRGIKSQPACWEHARGVVNWR